MVIYLSFYPSIYTYTNTNIRNKRRKIHHNFITYKKSSTV